MTNVREILHAITVSLETVYFIPISTSLSLAQEFFLYLWLVLTHPLSCTCSYCVEKVIIPAI